MMSDNVTTVPPNLWWRLLLERLGRQAAQTALPILAVIASSTGRVDIGALGSALAGALLVTVLKSIAFGVNGIQASSPVNGFFVHLLDRALPAAAGVAVGFLPVDRDLWSVHWASVGWAALAAAVIAQISVYATPPAYAAAARPDGVQRRATGDRGNSRVPALITFAAIGLTFITGPASATIMNGRPQPRDPVLIVPVITQTFHGCQSGTTFLRFEYLPAIGGGQALKHVDGVAGVRIEGWFDGSWRPTKVIPVRGGLLAFAGWGTWHAVVDTPLGEVTGPRSGVGGDQCFSYVDTLAGMHGGTQSRPQG